MDNREDSALEKAIEEAMDDEVKITEMPREEIKFSSLNEEKNDDTKAKENAINFTSIDESTDNEINKAIDDDFVSQIKENDINIPINDDVVSDFKLDEVESNNTSVSDIGMTSEIPMFNEVPTFDSNVYNDVQTQAYNDFNSVGNSEVEVNQNTNTDGKKDKRYIGYNQRLLIHVAIIVVLALISLITLVNSISLNTKSNLTYKQTSNLDYRVGLKPNNYYKEPYLEKGMQYIASLIDYIDINFNYNFKASENINYKYIYYVNADVKVTDSSDESKIIYAKNEKITEEKIVTEENSNSFSINENVKVNYATYNDLVKGFKSSYAINADSNLELSLVVEVEDEKGNKIKSANSNDKMTIKIPLTEQMINIKLDYNEINNSENAAVYKEFSISSKTLFIISIIFIILTVAAIVLLVRFLNKTSKKKSLYDIKLSKILREYDRVIITSRKKIKETGVIVDVNSFEELLDARDNLEKPIIFSEIHKGQKSVFIVNSDNESYRYVLKQADLEKEDQK